MTCQQCGRGDGHNLGCPVAARKRREVLREHARNLVEPDFTGSLGERERTRADEVIREHTARLEAVVENTKPLEEREGDNRSVVDTCAKDGCTEPRAASKGPRPARYCEDHKTTSRKKE